MVLKGEVLSFSHPGKEEGDTSVDAIGPAEEARNR
jgi:hypothetical protein